MGYAIRKNNCLEEPRNEDLMEANQRTGAEVRVCTATSKRDPMSSNCDSNIDQ